MGRCMPQKKVIVLGALKSYQILRDQAIVWIFHYFLVSVKLTITQEVVSFVIYLCFKFLGKTVSHEHLKVAGKDEQDPLIFLGFGGWRGRYLGFHLTARWRVFILLAEGSVIFYLCSICNTLESRVTRVSAHLVYAWIECIHNNVLQLLCVYLDVKHLWPLFTALCYLVFQTCNSIYLCLNHKVLLTTVSSSCPTLILPGNMIAVQSLPNPGSCREAAWVSWRVLSYNIGWGFFDAVLYVLLGN